MSPRHDESLHPRDPRGRFAERGSRLAVQGMGADRALRMLRTTVRQSDRDTAAAELAIEVARARGWDMQRAQQAVFADLAAREQARHDPQRPASEFGQDADGFAAGIAHRRAYARALDAGVPIDQQLDEHFERLWDEREQGMRERREAIDAEIAQAPRGSVREAELALERDELEEALRTRGRSSAEIVREASGLRRQDGPMRRVARPVSRTKAPDVRDPAEMAQFERAWEGRPAQEKTGALRALGVNPNIYHRRLGEQIADGSLAQADPGVAERLVQAAAERKAQREARRAIRTRTRTTHGKDQA